MTIKLQNYETGFGAELLCPDCNSQYMHHDKVEVFDRSEDQEKGLHVLVANNQVTFDNNLEGNPSLRRHCLKIGFQCESCQIPLVMKIVQHKGVTYINLVKLATNLRPKKI